MMRLLFILLFFVQTVTAQTSEKYHNIDAIYYRGEDLFIKSQFGNAREVFHEYAQKSTEPNSSLHIKARYYEAVSALELFNTDAVSLLLQFMSDYPETIYRKTIYQKLGNYFYQKKEYPEVIAWYSKLDKNDIPEEERPAFFFKLGYANFQEGNMKAARDNFYEVKDTPTQYASPATYYFAHISYQEKSYQVALENFTKLLDDARFKEVVPYYITQIYYLQGNYEEVIRFAPGIIDSVQASGASEMKHLIGDAYYKIGEYDEAIPYLKEYGQTVATTREDDYQLGYAYYKSLQYNDAIRMFDRVTKTKDDLGQIALYHIGESYLSLENYAAARTAFEAAASLEFDEKIQEDALYRSAILSYKLAVNPYDEAIEAFELYLERYPNSPRKKEVYSYLVNVYMTTKKYQKALDAIDKVENKDIELKSAYQLIAYNKGVDEYSKSDYTTCIQTFKLVQKYPSDPKLLAQSIYWTADAQFHLEQYQTSIDTYRSFLAQEGSMYPKMKGEAYYNMAYAYFNLGNVEKAAEIFRTYAQEPVNDKKKLADAFLRIGDSYYLLSDKNPSVVNSAIDFYQKAIDMNQGMEDRALFYQSKCYGFVDQRSKQIQCLSDIINNYSHSSYMVKSIFEVAIISRNENKDNDAIRYFEQIIRDYPTNNLVRESVYELGVTYLKKDDLVNAEVYLNKALTEYGQDNEMCHKASLKMLEVYQKSGQLTKINQLAKTYPCAGITGDLQDSIYFNVAFDLFLDSNYTAAISKFESYLSSYPNGLLRYRAYNCLADCYFEKGNKELAYQNYMKVLEGPNVADYETALARTANYEYNKKEYSEALIHYSKLATTANSPGRIYVAHLGLMRCNFLLENWANALEEAQLVWADGLSQKSEKIEAKFTEGVANSKLQYWDDAFAPLMYVIDNSASIMASQASYTIAEVYYEKKEYKKSTDQIRLLLKMKPAYDYWVAKGLILQSRISIVDNDLFQAEYTLNSVIKNYKVQDDGVLEEANTLMNEIMQLKNAPPPEPDSTQTIIEINENTGGQKP